MCDFLKNIASIAPVITALTSLFAATVAYRGLNKWLSELRAKTNFDTARNLIRATYKLRDAIKRCRSPLFDMGEFPENYSYKDEEIEERIKALEHIYGARWLLVSEALQEFDTHKLEAEALWGKSFGTITDNLRNCVARLNDSISQFIHYEYQAHSKKEILDDKFYIQHKQDVNVYVGVEDELSRKLDDAIQKIEDKLRPYMKLINSNS